MELKRLVIGGSGNGNINSNGTRNRKNKTRSKIMAKTVFILMKDMHFSISRIQTHSLSLYHPLSYPQTYTQTQATILYLNSKFQSNYSFIWNWINFSKFTLNGRKRIQLEISLDLLKFWADESCKQTLKIDKWRFKAIERYKNENFEVFSQPSKNQKKKKKSNTDTQTSERRD